jgi:CrcB protein
MKKFALLSALGAAIGTLLRYAAGEFLPRASQNDFPIAILIVNIVGAFAIGVIANTPSIMNNETRRFFLVTGVLGGFTTYSAFAVDVVNMNLLPAASYVIITFSAGLAATHIGSVIKK